MQLKNIKQYRPLHCTSYIGSTKVDHMQINLESTLSIIPLRFIQFLKTLPHKLTLTNTIIFDLNTNGIHPLVKIKLRCQIRNLKTKVTYYVIDADTMYLLLGRPWIYTNMVVLSTLYQYMEYVDEDGEMHILIVEKQSFKGVENYFTNTLLYVESAKVAPP